MKAKLPYKEGDWIAVPLRHGGYAIGIIARARKGGKALIGYFFGPLHETMPTMDDTKGLKPSDAVLISNFGDFGLINGQWSVMGHSAPWNRADWPNPVFVRRDSLTGKPSKVYYAEDDPNCEIKEQKCSEAEAGSLPEDCVSGYGAVEIKLTKFFEKEKQLV